MAWRCSRKSGAVIQEAGLAFLIVRASSRSASSGTDHSSIRRRGPWASVRCPRRLTFGCPSARARSCPSGVSGPWPAVEMVTSFAPWRLRSAVRSAKYSSGSGCAWSSSTIARVGVSPWTLGASAASTRRCPPGTRSSRGRAVIASGSRGRASQPGRAGAECRVRSLGPATTQAALIGQLVAHLNIYGNAFLGKYRQGDRVEQLALIHPDRVTVELRAGTPRIPRRGTVWLGHSARPRGRLAHPGAVD